MQKRLKEEGSILATAWGSALIGGTGGDSRSVRQPVTPCQKSASTECDSVGQVTKPQGPTPVAHPFRLALPRVLSTQDSASQRWGPGVHTGASSSTCCPTTCFPAGLACTRPLHTRELALSCPPRAPAPWSAVHLKTLVFAVQACCSVYSQD